MGQMGHRGATSAVSRFRVFDHSRPIKHTFIMEQGNSSIDWEDLIFLTPKEVAEMLSVPLNHVMTLAAGWHIPVFRVAGNLRFEAREIAAYAEVEKSPELTSLARVRRARQRTLLMLERRLSFDSREVKHNHYNLMSKHIPLEVSDSLKFTPPKNRELKQLLTPEEVAKQLKISKVTLSRLLHGGQIGYYKIGSLMRIDPTDLEKYLAKVRHEVWVR